MNEYHQLEVLNKQIYHSDAVKSVASLESWLLTTQGIIAELFGEASFHFKSFQQQIDRLQKKLAASGDINIEEFIQLGNGQIEGMRSLLEAKMESLKYQNPENGIRLIQEKMKELDTLNSFNNALCLRNELFDIIPKVCGKASFKDDEYTKLANKYFEIDQTKDFSLLKPYLQEKRKLLASIIEELEKKKSRDSDNERKPINVNNSTLEKTKDSSNKTMFFNNRKTYTIGIGLFWAVFIPLISVIATAAYFIGNTKYDVDKIALVDENKALKIEQKSLQERIYKDSVMVESLQKEVLYSDSLNELALQPDGATQKKK